MIAVEMWPWFLQVVIITPGIVLVLLQAHMLFAPGHIAGSGGTNPFTEPLCAGVCCVAGSGGHVLKMWVNMFSKSVQVGSSAAPHSAPGGRGKARTRLC